jgi:outer membrane protein assembly factor BamB
MTNLKLKAALTLAAALPMLQLNAADWTLYRGSEGIGITKESVTPWTANGPKEVWKAPTEGGFSSFTIAKGKAFTQVLREVDGVKREVCVALNADSGEELWAVPVGMPNYGHDGGNAGDGDNKGGDGPRSTPTTDGDRVYVTSSDLAVSCFDAATGKPVWKHDLIKENAGVNITWKNAASPVLDGDLLFTAGGGSGQALMAFNKGDGRLIWKSEDDKMTHATPVVATIHGIRQVIFFTQKGLVALETQTGKPLWRQNFQYNVSTAASPVVAGDLVYCSAGYGVGAGLARITKSGDKLEATEVWRKKNDLFNHWSTPIYFDGHLYGMFSFKEYGKGPLKCVELATGQEKWSKPGFGAGNVVLAGNTLVVLGDAGQLALVQATPTGYKELAQKDVLEGKCWSTPAVANGRVYVRSTKEAKCLDLTTKVASR